MVRDNPAFPIPHPPRPSSTCWSGMPDYVERLQADNGELRAALAALYEWYDRDGSIGGASEAFEARRHFAGPTEEEKMEQVWIVWWREDREAGVIRAYADKQRADEDLEMLRFVEGGRTYFCDELPIYSESR